MVAGLSVNPCRILFKAGCIFCTCPLVPVLKIHLMERGSHDKERIWWQVTAELSELTVENRATRRSIYSEDVQWRCFAHYAAPDASSGALFQTVHDRRYNDLLRRLAIEGG